MAKLKELVALLESIAPLHLQESYDNSGLIVGDRDMEITGVTVCLDSTEAVIDDAIASGCNVVVAHHPIVFSGLRQFTGETYIQRTILKAIKNDVAIYAIHTNLDNVLDRGVNEKIAQKIGLKEISILSPKSPDTLQIGAGVMGNLTGEMKILDFISMVKEKMKCSSVKYTSPIKENIQKIAICGGSGSFLLDAAIATDCDIFISSDFKYHQFFDANDKIVILDIGHYETEQFTIDLLVEIISDKFSNFASRFTKVDTNPVKYM